MWIATLRLNLKVLSIQVVASEMPVALLEELGAGSIVNGINALAEPPSQAEVQAEDGSSPSRPLPTARAISISLGFRGFRQLNLVS